jgi:hypothetical protein
MKTGGQFSKYKNSFSWQSAKAILTTSLSTIQKWEIGEKYLGWPFLNLGIFLIARELRL